MGNVGIIAEYNPFHNGHKYQIEEAKRVSGAEKAVIIMSGSFVQRGEPACADKFKRAEWAISCGADMVIELPDVFALSCAERFASGGVRILAGTGLVDSICFGSETGSIEALERMADKAVEGNALSDNLKSGMSYPAALSAAGGVSPSPNDILGIEYIKAVRVNCPDMSLYTVKRTDGGYNDDELGGEFSSALAIRRAFSNYSGFSRMSPAVFDGISRALPRCVLEDVSNMIKAGSFPSTDNELSASILYKFRCLDVNETASLPDVSEGLENLFARESLNSSDYLEMLSRIKSKRYTMARLKRIAMCGLLGITSELQTAAFKEQSALYARILAVRSGSESLLNLINKTASIPVITKASDRNALPKIAAEIERISALAHTLRALGQPYDKHSEADSSHRLIVR